MIQNPDLLTKLIEQVEKLPGLGEKSAERIAIYLLKAPKEYIQSLCKVIQSVKDIRYCPICGNLTMDNNLCPICANPYRDKSVLCVVEEVSDLWALEQTGAYKGLYHILGGRIAPLEKVSPEDLTIRQLLERIKKEGIEEVILATNHTLEGDATAAYIWDRLNKLKVKVSRIARGIPAGSRIETATRPTLADALRERKMFNPNFLKKDREKVNYGG